MDQEEMMFTNAATTVNEYSRNHTVQFDASSEEIERMLAEFREKFAPSVLKEVATESVLRYIFLTADGNNDSLCYHLEFNPKYKRTFGSISGGSSFKFGLFQRQEDGKWMTGSPKVPQELSEEDALAFGISVRDNLVKACELIEVFQLESTADYERLDDELNTIMGKFASYAWVQKYLHMIFPEKFVGWYVADLLKHFLYGFGIVPSAKYYGLNGQLALIKQKTGLCSPHFQAICYAMFGDIKHFYRLGSSGETSHYADEWREKGIVAVGWKNTGDLLNYLKNGSIDKDRLAASLETHYYPADKRTASRKSGEIKSFYETSSSSVFVVMDGMQLIGFVDGLSPYYFDDSSEMAHQKSGTWRTPFSLSDRLPDDEGTLTTCYEIRKTDNLIYLYKKYYGSEKAAEEKDAEDNAEQVNRPIKYQTGYRSHFAYNRILFGAPGTGKSYLLKQDAASLISAENEDDYERVTFHPDYSYANFVGVYKPVPTVDSDGKDSITYQYIPGPFMRILVKALKNSRSEVVRPFLLIIEEINRANVAAVFGDIFQLLDRDDDGVSEYPIQTSEDIKKYLAKELGGLPEEYAKIRIPDNMFIWASMNSADQGVFPMDTAFKRRWDFKYLGIDDSDELIRGKYVLLGANKDQKVEWNKLRKAINNYLAKEKINEDKQLGPYFLARSVVVPSEGDEIDRSNFIRTFKNKVIMYLFEDAAKQKRSRLFEGCAEGANRYSEICKAFDLIGIGIFNREIQVEAEPEEIRTTATE